MPTRRSRPTTAPYGRWVTAPSSLSMPSPTLGPARRWQGNPVLRVTDDDETQGASGRDQIARESTPAESEHSTADDQARRNEQRVATRRTSHRAEPAGVRNNVNAIAVPAPH